MLYLDVTLFVQIIETTPNFEPWKLTHNPFRSFVSVALMPDVFLYLAFEFATFICQVAAFRMGCHEYSCYPTKRYRKHDAVVRNDSSGSVQCLDGLEGNGSGATWLCQHVYIASITPSAELVDTHGVACWVSAFVNVNRVKTPEHQQALDVSRFLDSSCDLAPRQFFNPSQFPPTALRFDSEGRINNLPYPSIIVYYLYDFVKYEIND